MFILSSRCLNFLQNQQNLNDQHGDAQDGDAQDGYAQDDDQHENNDGGHTEEQGN